jgi:hypothetical protein
MYLTTPLQDAGIEAECFHPTTERLVFRELREEGEKAVMEFRIVYRGALHAQGKADTRAREKHAIRKYLHPQLKEFWEQNRGRLADPNVVAADFDRCGFKFCPVVHSTDYVLGCSIDILFLRRDGPGNLIS